MKDIYITAAITTLVVCIPLVATVLRRRSSWPLILVIGVVSLFEFHIAFAFIRIPLDEFLRRMAVPNPVASIPIWYLIVSFLYGPVIEEVVKWAPATLPALQKRINIDNRLAVGIAAGLGFGIGEIWYLAGQIAHVPSLSGYQWYQYGGFFYERLFACLFHATFTALAIRGFPSRKTQYLLSAVMLHALANLPILLLGSGVIKLSQNLSSLILLGYLPVFGIGAGLFMNQMAKADKRMALASDSTERPKVRNEST